MATFNKFNSFAEEVAHGAHNLSTDQLKIALTNVAPTATDEDIADLTEISYTNLSSRDVTTASSGQTSGTYKLVLDDLVLSATGTVATFRYVVLYNDDADDKLIGWYDTAQSVELEAAEAFSLDFDGTDGALTLV
jgi:hypothetical protein